MRMLETISNIRFLLPLLVLMVSAGLNAADMSSLSSVACVRSNCESSPMSCENNFLKSVEQLQCEQLRDNPSPLAPDGFCSCMARVSATLNGTNFTKLNERRVA